MEDMTRFATDAVAIARTSPNRPVFTPAAQLVIDRLGCDWREVGTINGRTVQESLEWEVISMFQGLNNETEEFRQGCRDYVRAVYVFHGLMSAEGTIE